MNNTAIFGSTDEALSSSVCLEEGRGSPFSLETITITKAERIELKAQAGYWKAQAGLYKAKFEKAAQDILVLEAKVKDLQQRLFGKKTEKQSTPASEKDGTEAPSTRKRGQQPGSQGHGRTPRPNLPVLAITQDLPESAKCCQRCGLPHQAKPALDETSEVIEVEVSAHVRRYKRTAYVRNAACHCPDTPMIITPPPPPRLLPKSPYGVGFWSEAMLAKFHYGQPIHRYCQDLHDRGLPVSPGTVASGLQSLLPLFTPVYEALYQKQMTERLFFNDETRWEVFEAIEAKVGWRWYLWLTRSASVIYYVIDPSRSAAVPGAHFKGLSQDRVIIVCDRYSAYKKLARLLPIILLAFCWAHVRRDFLNAGKAFAELADWAVTIKKHIGTLYHLNKQRLMHWNPERPLTEQNAEFSQHHQRLQQALNKLHQHATDLVADSDKADAALSKAARNQQRKICQSLLNHWPGLMVFVLHPEVPMDNNLGENSLRGPVTGRKSYYGSGSILSAQLAAMLFSILQTLGLWGINPRQWLTDYLTACAENGGRAPEDLAPYLPWFNPRLLPTKASQPIHSRAPPPPSGAEVDTTGNTLH